MTDDLAKPIPASDGLSANLRALTASELSAASAILTRGMLDNPLHMKVFGADPDLRSRRLSRFLGPLLAYVHANGGVTGAFVQGQLIGMLGMITPGRCRPTLPDRLRFGRALVTAAPPTVLLRARHWLAAWARHDPDAPHWHIGPLAVLPGYRRRGVGRRLMEHCCQHLDGVGATAWLETDLDINVGFYQGFGFELAAQEPVLGAQTWFMRRAPIEAAG